MEYPWHQRSEAGLIPTSHPSIQRRVFISGRVQGVGFRKSTQAHVSRFPSLRGYVRNLKDGRVEAVFCGDLDEVLQAVAFCKSGPPAAQVEILEIIEETPDTELPQFELRKE